MQIAFNISTEGIEQRNNKNTAEDHKETAILVSTKLHFLDREFEYQCNLGITFFVDFQGIPCPTEISAN